MFISFLMPYIDRGRGPIFSWIMAAQAAKFSLDELVIIADARYLPQIAAEFSWGEEVWPCGVRFRNLDYQQWQNVRILSLPDEVFKELDARSTSMLDAFRILLTEDYPPLTAALRSIIGSICLEQNPEAILSWCNVPSLELVADEFNLPVIHNELGPFRQPNYQGTVYFDFKGVNARTSAEEDMKAFLEVCSKKCIPLLSMDEMRQILMVDPARASELKPPIFKSGAALQVEDDSNLLAFSHGLTNFELIYAARKGLDRSQILIRHHPLGHLDYGESLGVPDNSIDSIEFISRCERIFCINSSVAFEALLLDKPVYVLGESPATSLSYERRIHVSPQDWLARLNYLFLGFLMPVSLLFDAEYYRWRLTYPPLEDIYQKHLQIFRKLSGATPESDPVSAAMRAPAPYIHRFSNSAEVLSIGARFHENGQFPEAKQWLETVHHWQNANPAERAEACFLIADIRRREGNEAEQKHYILEGSRIFWDWKEGDPSYLYKLGIMLYRMGEWSNCQEYLQAFIDSEAADPKAKANACFAMAAIYRRTEEDKSWKKLMARAKNEFREPFPPDHEELFETCFWLCRKGDWKQFASWRAEFLQLCVRDRRNFADQLFQLADICKKSNQDVESACLLRAGIKQLETAMEKMPSDSIKLARRLRELGDQERAWGLLEELISQKNRTAAPHEEALDLCFEIGKELKGAERKRRFCQLAEILERIGPEKIQSCWRASEVFLELGKWKKARAWYCALLQCQDCDSGSRIEIMAALAAIDKKLGKTDWVQWVESIAEFIKHHPRSSEIDYYRVGSLYQKAGKNLLAISWFQRALSITESKDVHAGVCFHLGEIALRQKKYSDALRSLERCLKLNPLHEKARLLRKKARLKAKASGSGMNKKNRR
jgi:tetratricopeptide (TPR) repeat protein